MTVYILGTLAVLALTPSFVVAGLLVLHLCKCGWFTFWETIPEEPMEDTFMTGSEIDGHVYLWRWRPSQAHRVLLDLIRKRQSGELTGSQAVKIARDVRTVVEMERMVDQ